MKQNIAKVVFLAICSTSIFGAEPSAFGAGDLDNPKPYGLTSSEKAVLENKKAIKKISIETKNQSYKVDSLRDRLDGMQSVIEGLNQKAQENKLELQKLKEQYSSGLSSASEYEKRLSEVVQENTKTIKELNTTVSNLSELVDEIDKTYVSKEQYNALVKDFNKFKSTIAKHLKISVGSSKYKNRSKAQISKDAYNNYKKKYYTKSIQMYEYLIEKNYKPAYAHYMIGVMNYRRKNYANAIAYFKKSASIYSKGSYMPTLMLYTARSMQLTHDKKNARKFYNALIAKYPNTKEAQSAKKYLGSLK